MKIDRKSLELWKNQSSPPTGCRAANPKDAPTPKASPPTAPASSATATEFCIQPPSAAWSTRPRCSSPPRRDYYRTRLTHTLEVAQIGRTIARALGANEDLVEAICLAHDLGHSPFGHSGEVTLAHLMKDDGGFDHNKQSLRIVDELEDRFPNFHGLNLTWEVREGIVKHESEYDQSDADKFNPQLRGHIEAQITNVADELAYTAHDLDDGLHSGIITLEDLGEIEIWKSLTDGP